MDSLGSHSLPAELLLDLFGRLSAIDAQSINNAYSGHPYRSVFTDTYNSRMSIPAYFTNYGFDADKIMKVLRESGAYLIGSRAAHFFEPKYVHSKSNWDFLMSTHDKSYIYHFMINMEKLGVEWETLDAMIMRRVLRAYEVQDILPNDAEDYGSESIPVSMQQINTMQDMVKSDKYDTERLTKIINIARRYINNPYKTAILYDDLNAIVGRNSRNETPEVYTTANCNSTVIKGKITLNNKVTNIRLILTSEPTLHDFLLTIPLSTLQCFISGYGACHLYGNVACNFESYYWAQCWSNTKSTNYDITYASEILANKYETRKLSIIPPPKHTPRNLSTKDYGAIVVRAPNKYNWQQIYWDTAQLNHLEVHWKEEDCRTKSQTDKGKQELLEKLNNPEYYKFRKSLLDKINNAYLLMHGVITHSDSD